MKKIVVFLLCSMFLYGAGLQKATVSGAELSKATTKVDLKKFKNAKKVVFVETNPAQFTIKVPVDLDSVKGRKGKSRDEGKTATGKSYMLRCALYTDDDFSGIYYYEDREIQSGQHTVTFRFNGIPVADALKISTYQVFLNIIDDEGNRYIPFEIFDTIETDSTTLTHRM